VGVDQPRQHHPAVVADDLDRRADRQHLAANEGDGAVLQVAGRPWSAAARHEPQHLVYRRLLVAVAAAVDTAFGPYQAAGRSGRALGQERPDGRPRTRESKEQGVSQETLRGRWRQRAEELAFRARDLDAVLAQADRRPLNPVDRDRILTHLGSAERLTQEASTFCRRDVVRAVCEQLPAGAEAFEVEHLADRFLSTGHQVIQVTYTDGEDLVPVGDTIRRGDGRAISARVDIQRYSTHELVALEPSPSRS
jgi:hypothetical protein